MTTNFNWWIDGGIVLFYLAASIGLGLAVRKYVRSVSDFLLAGRKVDLYLGIASLSATEFGIATCMSNAQLGYKYGLAGITPGLALTFAMLVIGYTGFCIKPLRDHAVITVPELFEQKFGKKVRWASGVVIVLGGLLNMGVFLRQAGDFLAIVCGFDPAYLEAIMTAVLLGIALYTILGGMLSVLITDYLQFVVMSTGLIAVVFLLFAQFGWAPLLASAQRELGDGAFNPFINGQYGWDRVVLDLFLAFASILTWQTMITRVLAARDTRTGQRIYIGTSPFFLVRFVVPAILGLTALHLFGAGAFAGAESALAMPSMIAQVVPIGLIGLLAAAMLAADMSTNSSYMLAWSSVIYNDIMEPIHQNKWPEKRGLYWNRMLIAGIGIFLLLYGLWYPLKGDLWVYLQITGTIYLASMTTILIAACYWKAANNWGAIAAIIVGSVIPSAFLVMEQLEATQQWAAAVGPYKTGIATYLLTGLAMVVGSWMKRRVKSSVL